MSDEDYEPGEIGRRLAEARRRYARTWFWRGVVAGVWLEAVARIVFVLVTR